MLVAAIKISITCAFALQFWKKNTQTNKFLLFYVFIVRFLGQIIVFKS